MEGAAKTRQLTEVGIIGAGISGLALAIALRQAGLRVRVYERDSDPAAPARSHPATAGSDGGGLVELTANGSRVLHALGLKQALADAAIWPQFSTVRHARTGFLLSQRPLGQFSDARYGAPSGLIHRDSLVSLLRQAALDQQVPIEYGALVQEIDTARGSLSLAGGESHQHLALVVASGRPDDADDPGLANLLETRQWISQPELTLIRARGRRTIASRDHGRFINTWLQGGLAVVEQPTNDSEDDQQVELIIVNRLENGAGYSAHQGVPEGLLASMLEPLHVQLNSLVDELDACRVDTLISEPAQYWHAGKTAMIGEASHGHPHFPTLGPAASLEDAWILSRMMERWEESPHAGFSEFERFRKPRAARLRTHANSEIELLTVTDSFEAWRRNLKWSLTSRFLPEIAMQRLDWLYGYDCIKGFL